MISNLSGFNMEVDVTKYMVKGDKLILNEQDDSSKIMNEIKTIMRTLGMFDASKSDINIKTNIDGDQVVCVKTREQVVQSEELVKLSKRVDGFQISSEYNGGKSYLVFEFLI